MTTNSQYLTAALNLVQVALPHSGPAGQHAARLRVSLDLAAAATDHAAYVAHLKDARRAADLALDVLQEEAQGSADTEAAPDVRP